MKVLLVDDNSELRAFLAQTLAESSIDVVEAGNSEQALKSAAEGGFDAYIIDSMLEGDDSIELISKLKSSKQGQAIPTLWMSNLSTALARRLAQNVGCTEFLAKPFSPSHFIEAIRKMEKSRR